MTKEYFNTKEDYLLFRKHFAAAVNHNNAKPHLEPADEWLSSSDEFSKGTGTHRVNGWMTATHYILLNILRNKSPKRGFTPITNKNKLEMYGSEWAGFDSAYNNLIRLVKIAKTIKENNGSEKKWHRTMMDRFLLPLIDGNDEMFDRYVNILANIELSETTG